MKAELDEFSFSDDEKFFIETAMTEVRPWESELVSDIKKRIKDFHLELNGKMCCYCYRDLTGEFSLVIDIEHVLPKRHFRPLTFDIKNLSVACKRCNMKMKRDKLDFLNLPVEMAEIAISDKYKIIHPNIDDKNSHLKRVALQCSDIRIVKYVPIGNSEKGLFSYQYFQLKELEIDSFDAAQNANQTESEAIAAVRALVKSVE
jgi:uncharacterized protein (TIGR02646 family)